MSRLQQGLTAGIWAAAIAGTVLAAPDDQWFSGALAAGCGGVLVALAWFVSKARRRWWAIAAILSVVGGLTLFAMNRSAEANCVTTDASGQRVVIGREFTEAGRQYQRLHPSDDNKAILESLADLGPQDAWTQRSIDLCRLKLTTTAGLWLPLFGVGLTCALWLMSSGAETRRSRKRVFISYHHEDRDAALMVRDLLLQQRIDVTIDADQMQPGQRIEDFIKESIRDSDAVVSIVSKRSLLSSWVALETIHSLQRNQWVGGKVFIGCYLADDFLQPEFRLECTRQIDARLAEIQQLIPQYEVKNLDPLDLNEERTRLFQLRNDLGDILATLKGSLCLDFREPQRVRSAEALVAAIRKLRAPLDGTSSLV